MTADSLDADVVVVGAGIAGGLLACKLAEAGAKVKILEAGPDVTRAELHTRFLNKRTYSPVDIDQRVDYAPTTHPDDPNAYLINTGKVAYNIHMTRAVGGTTWHWTAGCHRLPDVEFRLKSSYGVGMDWPIGYDDLVDYYTEAERELGVSAPMGDTDAKRLDSPPPMTGFVWPHIYNRLRSTLEPHGYRVRADAYARNAREYDDRPACRGNNTCWPLCPIGAQYAAIVHIDKARQLGVEVRDQCLATRVEVAKSGLVSAVVYRRSDGSEHKIAAKIFVLAANAIETPKILLSSRNNILPNGAANSSDQVGRNLMDHPAVISTITSREPLYPGRGPMAFAGIENFMDGDFRRQMAAASFAIDNKVSVDVIAGELLREGLRGEALDSELRYRACRTFEFVTEVEMLPEPNSRITLDWGQLDSAGQPRARVNFNLDTYTKSSMDYMTSQHDQVAAVIGTVKHTKTKGVYFGNHPMGAVRMGSDRRNSVVDAECRSHDHRNLFVASSAVFPTSGGAHRPTLTISALALRAADTILAQLKS